MKNQKNSTIRSIFVRFNLLVTALVFGILLSVSSFAKDVRAVDYETEIRALQSENDVNQSSAIALQEQAVSYQDAVNRLQSQINAIQGQIDASRAEQSRLEQEIIVKQAELDAQRELLANEIRAMYEDGHISTIEMLATSKNLSDFIDKEEYRNAVQENIQKSLIKVAQLQNDLKSNKDQIDTLLADIEAQQAQMAADRNQQAAMLAYTESQKDEFNKKISDNSSKIAELRRQQVIANSKYNIGSPGQGVNCGGGYPGSTRSNWGTWGCNHPIDNTIDNWGMYNRQCVSYTAFKVHSDFLAGRNSRDMPYWGGVGNANQWDNNAIRAGIPVNGTPKPGAIAVSNAGYYGHVMYVEQVGVVNGQQAIYVSDYNAGWDGRYREYWRSLNGLVFIHF